jgi:hypothetical protein
MVVGINRRRESATSTVMADASPVIGGDGADRDQRTAQTILFPQAGQQGCDRGQLVGLVVHCLTEHQAAGGGEGGDQMQRSLRRRGRVCGTRSRRRWDEVPSTGPGLAHSDGERSREQGRADAFHHNGQPALAWDSVGRRCWRRKSRCAPPQSAMGHNRRNRAIVAHITSNRTSRRRCRIRRTSCGSSPRTHHDRVCRFPRSAERAGT